MGNYCCSVLLSKTKSVEKLKAESEIKFWEELQNLNLTIVSAINKSKKTVEFNYTNLFLENFISIGYIVDYLLTDQNFFYFFTIFEVLIAMIDFLQIVFYLKKKYDINTENFFLINFEKFYLVRDVKQSNFYSKLMYIDEKINESYTNPEIMYKDDVNVGLSSFSMEESGKSYQMLLSTINSTNFKSTISIDLNSAFYSKSKTRYTKLRNNYSLQECEKFYAENFYNFLTKFIFKKVNFIDPGLEHDFNNFKFIFRHTLNHVFKNSDRVFDLQMLKEVMTNFYLNNSDVKIFKENLEKVASANNNLTFNKLITDKLLAFQQAKIQINYGDCDVILESDKYSHNLSFMYDNIFINNYSHSVCINCAGDLIFKKCPESRSDYMSLSKFENELIKKNSFIDFRNFLKYLCCTFSKYKIDDDYMFSDGEDIQIYLKNRHTIAFEHIRWDEYREEVLSNEILNLDIYVKNNVVRVKRTNNKSIILPNYK